MNKEYLENDFNQILKDWDNFWKTNDSFKNYSYSLLGSPLIKSQVLLLGNNWGGGESENQKEMLYCSDILCYPESPTYRGYINFFSKLFSQNDLMNFFNSIVYTNASFIRCGNDENANFGYSESKPYLEKLIEKIEPNIIIAFGRRRQISEKLECASHSLASIFNLSKPSIVSQVNTRNWKAEYFETSEKQFFLFPHSSKFGNIWGKEIAETDIFKKLNKRLQRPSD